MYEVYIAQEDRAVAVRTYYIELIVVCIWPFLKKKKRKKERDLCLLLSVTLTYVIIFPANKILR